MLCSDCLDSVATIGHHLRETNEIDWPEEYKHVIPPDTKMVLEMREIASGVLSRGKFFFLGCNREKGIAVWVHLKIVLALQTCLVLELSLEEVDAIRNRLQRIRVDLASDSQTFDGSAGLLRVQASEGFEVMLK